MSECTTRGPAREGTIEQRDGRVTFRTLDGRSADWSEQDQRALQERYAALLA